MNEMIERVAAAIDAAIEKSGGWDDGCADSKIVARAAIEAMRDATDEQRNAYYELSHKTETMMDAHWERAIDAALK